MCSSDLHNIIIMELSKYDLSSVDKLLGKTREEVQCISVLSFTNII